MSGEGGRCELWAVVRGWERLPAGGAPKQTPKVSWAKMGTWNQRCWGWPVQQEQTSALHRWGLPPRPLSPNGVPTT